ncbi:putative peroxisome biogenesis factor 1 [Neospora caninum Liverpool]|uniref:Peroxisome biogenesis factor 1, putative n=1 Tax=Neospora caninum (strain Liverpool) TaxID=572307 RepID=F0VMG9_NEOCL|nr:putative peroxisome biogenesis factor 1 [Neospora caninum Liverpool]CBZ54915.1 putative peroxisome biogenesis factor 1 [Neospora caninum Liverpool]CEL69636.1 TPA: peroxisome biogenesis factor 1, putative [Neospora caninum Liverpool]|eukprot:XP_003884943.1 putative peroxisome biogenesis factor 1 [Neospora caninum Liverpool]
MLHVHHRQALTSEGTLFLFAPKAVHGPSGSGRSSLCRTAGSLLSKTTGLFVLMVRCKLLAAEAVRFPIIKDLLVTIGMACTLHAPALLILDDLLLWSESKFSGTCYDYNYNATIDVKQKRSQRAASRIWTNLTLQNVGGLDKVKEDLIDMLKMETTYGLVLRRAGVSIHRGVLLIGPPGCGKTLVAKAVVGDQEMRCLEVKGPELLSKYIGSSEAAVRKVFTKAQQARPCIVLFDEIDALATRRGGDSSGVTDRVVNQLLCYLDGIEDRQDVYVIATTSRPDLVDPALLRTGRLEKVCYCGLPTTTTQRLEILKVCTNTTTLVDGVSLESLEQAMPWEFSAADIHAAVKSAQLLAVHELLGTTLRPPASIDGMQEALRTSNREERKKDEISNGAEMRVELLTEESESPASFEGRQVALQQDPSSRRVFVSQRHLLAAIAATKPSMTPGEIRRYHRLYAPFLAPSYIEDIRAFESKLSESTTHCYSSFPTTTADKRPSPSSGEAGQSTLASRSVRHPLGTRAFTRRTLSLPSHTRSTPAISMSASVLRSCSVDLTRSNSTGSFSRWSSTRTSGSCLPLLSAGTVELVPPCDSATIEAKVSSQGPSDVLFEAVADWGPGNTASLTHRYLEKSSRDRRSGNMAERHLNNARVGNVSARLPQSLVEKHRCENMSSRSEISSSSPKSEDSQNGDSRSQQRLRTASRAGCADTAALMRKSGTPALRSTCGPYVKIVHGQPVETREYRCHSTEVPPARRKKNQRKRRHQCHSAGLPRVALA